MRERPILFSGPMVRAILEGRKTQTRRVVNGRIALEWLAPNMFTPEFVAHPENDLCPYGGFVGDRLWVRETWQRYRPFAGYSTDHVLYRADMDHCGQCPLEGVFRTPRDAWKPSIHMPRWASRLTLEVKAVRVERLQEISEEDAIAEGIERLDGPTSCSPYKDYGSAQTYGHFSAPSASYRSLWDSINAKRGYGWETNPWVWVVEFERVAA